MTHHLSETETPPVAAEKNAIAGALLYVVGTPLGNLGDLSFRAQATLQNADLILAEDTRVTAKLLAHFGISKPLRSVREQNELSSVEYVCRQLAEGKSVAMVTDAGTPAISDPGAKLVDGVLKAGFRAVPIPGASAVIAALSASGFLAENFYFAGFLPMQKKARRLLLETLRPLPAALVFYEAPHRIRETLRDLSVALDASRMLVIARELTKTFETISRMPLSEALNFLDSHPEAQRGELVLIVDFRKELHRNAGKRNDEEGSDSNISENPLAADDETAPCSSPSSTGAEFTTDSVVKLLSALLDELPPSRAARVVSNALDLPRKEIYEQAMRLKKN